MRFVLDYLRPGETMFDVGANVGTYALLASTVNSVSVVAFEPSSVARARAARNLSLNGVSQQVHLTPYAVGRTSGGASLSTGLGACNKIVRTPTTSSSTELVGEHGSVESVEMVALDDFADASAGTVHLLKIDVEGLELDVLHGARRLIQRDMPALIVEANDPEALTSFLEGEGYSCYTYDPDARRLLPTVPSKHLHQNVIALAAVEEATRRLAAGHTKTVSH